VTLWTRIKQLLGWTPPPPAPVPGRLSWGASSPGIGVEVRGIGSPASRDHERTRHSKGGRHANGKS
jgi:hypothetical protein